MKSVLLSSILTGWACLSVAQSWPLTGYVLSEDNSPLVYSTVVLLNPADSTMQFYGITNPEGKFEIKNIRKGDYLLQVAFLGYETYYKAVSIPVEGNNLGLLTMKHKPLSVSEVSVMGEYVPLSFRGDTTVYNAAAFQLKPGAAAEDLLKKLPGVEVDRAGNIKAMGEDVRRVMVDGKEFFGNDPKVATKNVPADAVDKVQIYDRTSEESMFTGIHDGSRDKTINLQLKEESKVGLFGNVTGGVGTGDHRMGNGRAYRFSDKVQLAALGMANNINQFGFSFDDYMNFSGGLGSMMHGGGSVQVRITNDGSFPINFGQPVSGLNQSAAGGANFSYSKSQHDRAFLSYLGTGARKDLVQTTKTRNYTGSSSFLQNENLDETDKNQSHRVNFGWRSRIDSTQNLVIDGNLAVSSGNNRRWSDVGSFSNEIPVNTLDYRTSNTSERLNGSVSGSYLKKLNYGKSVFKLSGNLLLSQGETRNVIYSETGFAGNNIWENSISNIYQDNHTESYNASLGATLTQKAGRLFYIEPEIRAGNQSETLNRFQGIPEANRMPIDSLSPQYSKHYTWIRPRLSLIRNLAKTRLTIALQLESGKMANTLNGNPSDSRSYLWFLPYALYENEYRTGRRVMANLSSQINTPSVIQLLPVVNNINPMSVYYGNPELKPEKLHRLSLHWLIFDQFSFTSLMTTVSGTYTKDKINWHRTINNNLSFVNTLTNVISDYDARGNIDFSTPLRPLGLKVRLNLEERWNRGISLINKAENIYTNHIHRGSLTFDNRKKDKWDMNTGIQVTYTQSHYSVQRNLNNNYLDMSWFGEARFTPNPNWNFNLSADIANYSDQAFGESVSIPLLNAEINRYFLKNRRGTLTLRGFDLLDKNNIVQRLSELNYLREVRSNSIGRYVMLSFSYRLNRFGGEQKGIEVRMGR
jgi:hypothetical protein